LKSYESESEKRINYEFNPNEIKHFISDFDTTIKSFINLDISYKEVIEYLKICSVILFFGNIKFIQVSENECKIDEDSIKYIKKISKLLKVSFEDLKF